MKKKSRLWILGPDSPEMQEIETLLEAKGEQIAYGWAHGARLTDPDEPVNWVDENRCAKRNVFVGCCPNEEVRHEFEHTTLDCIEIADVQRILGCPGRLDLVRFLILKMPKEEAYRIFAHVSFCRDCSEFLQWAQSALDPWLDDLRKDPGAAQDLLDVLGEHMRRLGED